MLTGPVTILCWSFPRRRDPRNDCQKQIALALRDEVADLEAARLGLFRLTGGAARVYRCVAAGLSGMGCGSNAAVAKDDRPHMCYCGIQRHYGFDRRAGRGCDHHVRPPAQLWVAGVVPEAFDCPNEGIGPGIVRYCARRTCGVEWIDLKEGGTAYSAQRLWGESGLRSEKARWLAEETRAALANMVKAAHNLRQAK